MNVLMSNIPQQSIIDWRAGTPIKYGCYLVLCVHDGNLVIHQDVWFDDGRGWQSKWQNMVAWCHLDDIELKQQIHYTTLPEKLGIQVCPFLTRLRLFQEQLCALNDWVDRQFPINKDERQD